MRVSTFYDDKPRVEGRLVRVNGTGMLCTIVLDNGHKVARHISRVTPLDDDARRMLKKD